MSRVLHDLKTSYPHYDFDAFIEESSKDLADEIDKDILDELSLMNSKKIVESCNYMLSLTTTHETIILKKRTHKVFNRIRYNELGMRENYMINIEHINDDEIDSYVKRIAEKFKHPNPYSKDLSSSFQPNAFIGGVDPATKDYVDSMTYIKNKLDNVMGVPSRVLSKGDYMYDHFLEKYKQNSK